MKVANSVLLRRSGISIDGTRRPTLAILLPYWDFWEHVAVGDPRAHQLRLLGQIHDMLKDLGSIAICEVVDSDARAREIAETTLSSRPDVILVAQTMAVPPSFVLAVVDSVERVPILIWALHEEGLESVRAVDHTSIAAHGATVGAPMLANVLLRQARTVELLLGRLHDPVHVDRVRRRLRCALVAGSLRRARIGRVGDPLPGYLCVDAADDDLKDGIGVTIVRLAPSEVTQLNSQVADTRIESLRRDLDLEYEVGDVEEDGLLRSLRVALALEDMVIAHELDAGAMNCHVEGIRYGEAVGVTPCFGLGRLTGMGVPWTCTGDILTTIAMLIVKRLGGAALYHEIEAIDYRTHEVLIANSGEHDPAWVADGSRPRLQSNGWYCGLDPHCGVCAVGEGRPGPATLVAFTPHPDARGGFRLVAARGELTSRTFPATGTMNGAFRFALGPVTEAWQRWAEAGVNHHSCATNGDVTEDVAHVAALLGIEAVTF